MKRPSPRRFTRTMQMATTIAHEAYFETLRREYVWTIRQASRDVTKTFRRMSVPIAALTADANTPPESEPKVDPRFISPDPDQVVDREGIAETMDAKTRATRRAAAERTLDEMGRSLGISFDIGEDIFADKLLKTAGARAAALGQSIRDTVVKVIEYGLTNGYSVDETAVLMKQEVSDLTTTLAVALARTDLISVTNGASMAAAREVYTDGQADGTETQVMKTWLATEDERTRETHSEADGQSVPMDAMFSVGDDEMDYPGDPSGSDEETINCRCTFLIEEVTVAVQNPDANPEAKTAGPADAPEAVTAAAPLPTGHAPDLFMRADGQQIAHVVGVTPEGKMIVNLMNGSTITCDPGDMYSIGGTH